MMRILPRNEIIRIHHKVMWVLVEHYLRGYTHTQGLARVIATILFLLLKTI